MDSKFEGFKIVDDVCGLILYQRLENTVGQEKFVHFDDEQNVEDCKLSPKAIESPSKAHAFEGDSDTVTRLKKLTFK